MTNLELGRPCEGFFFEAMTSTWAMTNSKGRQCLFCDNTANSREHVWPNWILQQVTERTPIRMKMVKNVKQPLPNPERKFKALCNSCANGWIRELDELNCPLVRNLMQDVTLSLDSLQQSHIARWAIKMSMIRDFIRRRQRPLFFSQAEREQLRLANNWPMHTVVWLARCSCPGLAAIWGTSSWAPDKSVHAFVTTVVVGYFAAQTVTLRCSEAWDGENVVLNAAAGPRSWPELLTQIWPTTVSAQWPPSFSFDKGGVFSIGELVRRYSYQIKVQGAGDHRLLTRKTSNERVA